MSIETAKLIAKRAVPSKRTAQRAETRRRLQDGARALFATKPYHDATIDEIAAHAGISRATFYLHYDGKQALLRDLLADDMVAQRKLFERLVGGSDDPGPEAIVEWVRAYVSAFSRRRAALSLFYTVLGNDPDFLQAITAERDALFDDIGRHSAAFRFAPDAAGRARRVAAHLLIFQIEQFCTHAAFGVWDAAAHETGIAMLGRAVARFFADLPVC
jgi:AcrR family transcriptional regulator